MNATTGEILFAKEPHLRLPPASTTKVLTALLAMERLNPDSQVFVSPQAASAPPSRVGLRAGNAASAQDLLYGLLLKSGNDAAETLAEAAGGSIYGFASLMNAKAWQIGAHDSHFMNPHGLPDEDHYSTAYDLAIIFRYAMNYPMFADIVRTRSATLRIESGQGPYGDSRLVPVLNHNRLLASYEGARGGKTGFTLKARRCFVGEVDRGGTRLIVSILNSPNSGTLWQDARTLLDYGFTHYGLAPPPPMQPEVEPQPILVRRSPVVTPDRVRMAQVSPEAEEEAPESAMDSSSPPATTPEPSRAIIVRRTPVSPPNPERTVVMARSAVEDDEPEPVETRTTPVFDTPAVRQPAIAEKKLPTRVKAKAVAESPKAGSRSGIAQGGQPRQSGHFGQTSAGYRKASETSSDTGQNRYCPHAFDHENSFGRPQSQTNLQNRFLQRGEGQQTGQTCNDRRRQAGKATGQPNRSRRFIRCQASSTEKYQATDLKTA